MKILKIVLISIFGLFFLLFIAAVIFLKTFDINRYKPQIISALHTALNRDVNFEKASLGISLTRGINLRLSNFFIGEDPVFGKEEFLAVKDASFTVDALTYLRKKSVNIPNVLIDSCRVKIIRKKDGSLNVLSLSNTKEKTAPPAPLALPALLVKSLSLTNSEITYVDESFEPSMNFVVSDLNVRMNGLSLTEPFPFSVEAAVLSDKINIKIKGKIQINLKTNQVTIFQLKGSSDLSQIVMEKIPAALPMVKGAVLPTSLKGDFSFDVSKLTAGAAGIQDMNADVSIIDGRAEFKEMASPVDDIEVKVNITKDNIVIEKVLASIGRGTINASGQINDYMAKQAYNISAQAQDIQILDLISRDKFPVKPEGLLSSKIDIKGDGFTPEALKSTLSGESDISVKKAVLKDLNVLRLVLDKISVIPGITEKIEAGLSDNFKQKLTQKDTALQDIKIPVIIADGKIVIKEAVISADEFSFKASGQTGFDGTYIMEGSFFITQELSSVMVNAVAELKYLTDSSNRIYLPLRVTGQAANVNFNVDVEYMTKRIIQEQATKEIFEALDKALGTKDSNQTQQNDTRGEEPSPESTKDTLRNIFKDILK